jgi:hypothetical protein
MQSLHQNKVQGEIVSPQVAFIGKACGGRENE